MKSSQVLPAAKCEITVLEHSHPFEPQRKLCPQAWPIQLELARSSLPRRTVSTSQMWNFPQVLVVMTGIGLAPAD